jgi:hypothetical protein
MMASLLMLALGGGLLLTTTTEMTIAANHRDGMQVLYGADAGVDLAVDRLRLTADWQPLANARDGTVLLAGRLADVLQVPETGSLTVSVLALPDPNGDPDVLIVQSSAVAGAIRRTIQATVHRRAPDAAGARDVTIVAWR